MKFFKIFITLVSICTIVESSFGKNRGEGKILFQHWPGAKKFVEQLEGGHKEKCIFMKNMLLKHSDKPFVLQRISGSRKVLNCEDNYEYFLKIIKNENIVVRASAIKLAAKFSKESKGKIKKEIDSLRKIDDPLIQEALKTYFSE